MDIYAFVIAKESLESDDFVVHGVTVNDMLDNETKRMIQQAVGEVSKLFKMDNIYLLTDRKEVMEDSTSDERSVFSHNNILLPQIDANVATFGYAAMYITKKYEDGVICICSADSLPDDLSLLEKTINKGIKRAVAMDEMIIINTGEGQAMDGLLGVKEKQFFIWKASVFMKTVEEILPQTYDFLMKIGECIEDDADQSVLESIYKEMPTITLELGILPKARNIKEYFIDLDENEEGFNFTL
jgi:mannose-1-phosphate guanylyltransferase